MTGPDVLNEAVTVSGCVVSSVQGPAGVGAHPISRHGRWSRTGPPPGTTAVRCGSGLPAGLFVLDNANSQDRRVRGLAWLLDWLADQPGETWQQRWMASGADAAGGAWRHMPIAWLQARGRESAWLRARSCPGAGRG